MHFLLPLSILLGETEMVIDVHRMRERMGSKGRRTASSLAADASSGAAAVDDIDTTSTYVCGIQIFYIRLLYLP